MKKEVSNYYKTCRENAGLTQSKVSELLHISERSLSDYENNKTRVPDDIVDSMSKLYGTPLLAWWHIKNTSILGKYLPDISEPKTNGDMAFQAILAQDELDPAVAMLKKILADGVVSQEEEEDYLMTIESFKKVAGKLFSVVTCTKK